MHTKFPWCNLKRDLVKVTSLGILCDILTPTAVRWGFHHGRIPNIILEGGNEQIFVANVWRYVLNRMGFYTVDVGEEAEIRPILGRSISYLQLGVSLPSELSAVSAMMLVEGPRLVRVHSPFGNRMWSYTEDGEKTNGIGDAECGWCVVPKYIYRPTTTQWKEDWIKKRLLPDTSLEF